jgi:hypothetical protein
MKYILLLSLFFIACGVTKKSQKEIIVIPPNALFVINAEPVPAAFKVDASKEWVILDSAAALKALLKSVEENYKRALEMNRREQQRKDTIK